MQCWGLNFDGQLGLGHSESVGDDETPNTLPGGVSPLAEYAVLAAAGGWHVCAVEREGKLRCWGRGTLGRLGYGTLDSIGNDETFVRAVSAELPASEAPRQATPQCLLQSDETASFVLSIHAGLSSTCVLLSGNRLRCWGLGSAGRLGIGSATDVGASGSPFVGPFSDTGGRTIQSVDSYFGTCAVLDGEVFCWGRGNFGGNGYGNLQDVGDDEPILSVGAVSLASPAKTAVKVSRGDGHSCAVFSDNTARCWGRGLSGRLGTGATDNVGDDEIPSAVLSDIGVGAGVTDISAFTSHTCVTTTSNTARCFGFGSFGRLGYENTDNVGDGGTTITGAGDIAIQGSASVTVVKAGFQFSCALTTGGSVQCWGRNEYGQLGLNSGAASIGDSPGDMPTNFVGLSSSAVKLDVGFYHACALLDDGRVQCWGRNSNGQLGLGHTNHVGDDETVDSAGTAVLHSAALDISVHDAQSCAVLLRGAVFCWGDGGFGRLGQGNQDDIGDDELPTAYPAVPPVPRDMVLPFSPVLYESLAEPACPGSALQILNPRLFYIPSAVDTAGYLTVPPWWATLVKLAAGMDAPSLPFKTSLVCSQSEGDLVELSTANRIARSGGREERVMCTWPATWAAEAKVRVTSLTERDGVSPITASALGGDVLMLHGTLWPFPLVASIPAPSVLVGGRPCTGVSLSSITALTCIVPALPVTVNGSAVPVQLNHTVDGVPTVYTAEVALRYALPRVFAVSVPIGLPIAGARLQIIGQELGGVATEADTPLLSTSAVDVAIMDAMAGGAQVGACTVVDFWFAGILCDMPAGTGVVYLQVSIAGQAASSRMRVQYALPTLQAVFPPFALTADVGPQSLSFLLQGLSLGLPTSTITVSIGSTACTSVNRLNESHVQCSAIDGTALRGATQASVTISVDGATAVLQDAVRVYGAMSLNPLASQRIPRDGGPLVLSGLAFGRFPQSDPSVGPSGDILGVQLGAGQNISCTSIQVVGDSLTCTVPPGYGGLSPISVQRAGGAGASITADLAFARATIGSVSPDEFLHTPMGQGSSIPVVVTGTGFAISGVAQSAGALVGTLAGAPCQGGVRNLSPTSFECEVRADAMQPSSGSLSDVAFTLFGAPVTVQEGAGIAVSDRVVVSALQPSIVAAPGGERVEVLGSNFGLGRASDIANVTFGAGLCTAVTVNSRNSLTCTAPSAQAAGLGSGETLADVTVTTVTGDRNTFVSGVSYARPEILSVQGGVLLSHPPTSTARATVRVGGVNLVDGDGTSAQLSIAGVSCQALGGSVSFSPLGRSATCADLRLAALPSPPLGSSVLSNVTIVTTLLQVAVSNEGSVQLIGGPLISRLTPTRIAAGGEATLAGSNMGSSADDITSLSVGGQVLPRTDWEWSSSSSITILNMPPSVGDAVVDVPISITTSAGFNATTSAGSGATYIIPIVAPSNVPAHVCGYRVGSQARVVWVWRDDRTTLSNPVAQWWLDISQSPFFSDPTDSTLLVIPAESGETSADHIQSLPPSCRRLYDTPAMAALLRAPEVYLVDVRVSDAPIQPFWVKARAVTQDSARRVFAGNSSSVIGPIFEQCFPGEYLATQFVRGAAKDWSRVICEECPEGAECNGRPWEGIRNQPGFYAAEWDSLRLTYLPCELDGVCPQTPLRRVTLNDTTYLLRDGQLASSAEATVPDAVFDLILESENSSVTLSSTVQQCREGHTGALCASCVDGFADQGDGQCAPCADDTTIYGAILGGTLVAAIVIAYLIYSTIAAAGEPTATYVALNKILLTHMQQVALAAAFPLQWPGFLMGMFTVFEATSSVSESLISVECLRLDSVSQARGTAVTTLLIPLVALVILLLYWYAVYPCILYCRGKRVSTRIDGGYTPRAGDPEPAAATAVVAVAVTSAEDLPEEQTHVAKVESTSSDPEYIVSSTEGLIVSVIIVLFLLHLGLAEASLSLMTCVRVDTKLLLAGDLSIDCGDASNQSWMYGIGLPAFIFYGLGIPVASAVLLYRNRHMLFTKRGRAVYGFLFGSLEEKYYAWESVVQARKVVLTVIATVLAPLGLGLRITVSMFLMATAMAIHLVTMPYEDEFLDYAEAVSSLITLITLAAGSTLVDDTVQRPAKIAISIVVVLANAIFMIAGISTLVFTALRDPLIQETLEMAHLPIHKWLRIKPAVVPGSIGAVEWEGDSDDDGQATAESEQATSTVPSTLVAVTPSAAEDAADEEEEEDEAHEQKDSPTSKPNPPAAAATAFGRRTAYIKPAAKPKAPSGASNSAGTRDDGGKSDSDDEAVGTGTGSAPAAKDDDGGGGWGASTAYAAEDDDGGGSTGTGSAPAAKDDDGGGGWGASTAYAAEDDDGGGSTGTGSAPAAKDDDGGGGWGASTAYAAEDDDDEAGGWGATY